MGLIDTQQHVGVEGREWYYYSVLLQPDEVLASNPFHSHRGKKATRIAVVSTDGVHVDGHFGKADRFLIFDVKDKALNLVETRPSTPLSVDDPGHTFDAERFESVYRMIHDCQKVFTTHIGDTPANKLRVPGIETILYSGPISSIPL